MARYLPVLAVILVLREPVLAKPIIRLVDGPNDYTGRLEVFLNNVWGTVCDDYWEIADANVACRQLGFFRAESVESSTSYGTGEDPTQMDDVACTGTESSLTDCVYKDSTQENCLHSEDVSIVCIKEGVRLVDGPNYYSGRVDVFMNGGWGSVCDANWTPQDATVACRFAGFPRAVSAAESSAFFGSGPNQLLMGTVTCAGTEVSLMDCGYDNSSSLTCDHSQDVGVICSENIRLVDGPNSYTGRLEVFVDDGWGTVCDDGWDVNDAKVACRHLGFYDANSAESSESYETVHDPILMDEMACTGEEQFLTDCGYKDSTELFCGFNNVVSLACIPHAVRLVGGTNYYNGRVEVLLSGGWGSVCDGNWNIEDATVTCRHAGFPGAVSAKSGSFYGPGTGSILMGAVTCTGTEVSLMDCGYHNSSSLTCGHSKDVGVICSEIVRLVDGPNDYSGRLEVYLNGVWGTVCDDYWDIADANVACRQLGFSGAESAQSSTSYGTGQDPIQMDDVACSGAENSLTDCPYKDSSELFCFHSEDVSLVCIQHEPTTAVGQPPPSTTEPPVAVGQPLPPTTEPPTAVGQPLPPATEPPAAVEHPPPPTTKPPVPVGQPLPPTTKQPVAVGQPLPPTTVPPSNTRDGSSTSKYQRLASGCLDGFVLSNHMNVRSRMICAVECSATVQCRSFNFVGETAVCQLNSEVISNIDLTANPLTGTCDYYEKLI